MSSPMTCKKGHFYPATMSKCPFCERESGGEQAVKNPGSSSNLVPEDDKTRPMGQGQGRAPVSPGQADPSTLIMGGRTVMSDSGETERTIIHRPQNEGSDKLQPQLSRRKLEGWLVSFTMVPSGIDFRLYEGRNLVGRGTDCDIRLINDPKVSEKHALIVFREDESLFADEYFSTNPSYIDGERVALGARIPLLDGARIMMGDHEFIFRKVNP